MSGQRIDVMLDIETLDTKPSAVILSAAAVTFTEAEGVRDICRVTFDLQEQFSRGRTVSQSTLLWWMEQSDDARAVAFTAVNRQPVEHALTRLFDFANGFTHYYANSPSFDMVLLGSLAYDFNKPVPWSYRDCRDVRTLRAVAEIESDWQPNEPITGPAHDPVTDCLWQIALVREAKARLALKPTEQRRRYVFTVDGRAAGPVRDSWDDAAQDAVNAGYALRGRHGGAVFDTSGGAIELVA